MSLTPRDRSSRGSPPVPTSLSVVLSPPALLVPSLFYTKDVDVCRRGHPPVSLCPGEVSVGVLIGTLGPSEERR